MRALPLIPLLTVLANPAFGQDVPLQRCRAIAEPVARLACYDALADAPAGTRAPAAPPAVAAPEARPATTFGRPQRDTEPQEVSSAVGAAFAGWGPNSRIRLDNGQVWQVVDGSSVVLPAGARRATVKRSLFGNYVLEIDGLNTAPKVRRVD